MKPATIQLTENTSNEQILLGIGPVLGLRDNLLALKLAPNQTVWRACLELQFQMTKVTELGFLYGSQNFLESESVLEIGFGDDGYVIGHLAPYFPKHHVNVSLPTSILLAGKEKTKDVLALISNQLAQNKRKKFDYLILRLVIQHVSQLGLLVKGLSDYLNPGGRLLIIDSYDPYLKWSPMIPNLDRLIQTLAQIQLQSGGERSGVEKLHRKASLYKFTPEINQAIAVKINNKVDARNFYVLFLLMSEIIGRALQGKINQIKLISEMNNWINHPDVFGQLGMHFLQLKMLTK